MINVNDIFYDYEEHIHCVVKDVEPYIDVNEQQCYLVTFVYTSHPLSDKFTVTKQEHFIPNAIFTNFCKISKTPLCYEDFV